jgi:phage replication-related protein YjqB (UPF0714/DUF867 family)
VHLEDEGVHPGEHVVVLVHDDVRTLGHDLQLVVGDDGRDLDDDVVEVVETGHLEIHPHEHDHGPYRWHDDRVSASGPESEPSRFGRALAEPGVVEHVELRSPFGFMAFHGGALERQTDRIAVAAADAAGASLYMVSHPEPDRRTSPPRPSTVTPHRPCARSSTTCASSSPCTATAVTACSRRCCWGGRTAGSQRRSGRCSPTPSPTTSCSTTSTRSPGSCAGSTPDNPVNLPPEGGVQLELPPRVRGLGPRWADWSGDGLVPPAEALVDALAAVARSWVPST